MDHISILFDPIKHIGDILELVILLSFDVRLDGDPILDVIGEGVDEVVDNDNPSFIPIRDSPEVLYVIPFDFVRYCRLTCDWGAVSSIEPVGDQSLLIEFVNNRIAVRLR